MQLQVLLAALLFETRAEIGASEAFGASTHATQWASPGLHGSSQVMQY
jgi:hypothetical protein